MQLKWIEDLLVLAETKNFSRAAELRCITQSALSRRVRSLEEWVGVELVDRGTYPVELTLAGLTFCDQAREAVDILNEQRAVLRAGRRMPGRSIQLVAGHTLSTSFLPRWLKQFQQRHEYLSPFNARVVAANIHEAVISLAEGQCDLMVCYEHASAPILLDKGKFISLSLGSERFLPVSGPTSLGKPEFALPGNPANPIPYIAYAAGTFLGKVSDAVLKQAAAPCHLARCYEADMALLLAQMVKQGYGAAWLPESFVAEDLASGKLVQAADDTWTTTLEIRAFRAVGNTNETLQEMWISLERDRKQTTSA